MKNFARDYVIGLFNKVDKDGVIMLPAFDEALSCGEIMYDDQMLKCFVAEEPESVAEAADEFGCSCCNFGECTQRISSRIRY